MAEFFNEASEYHSIEARTEKISYYVQKFRFFLQRKAMVVWKQMEPLQKQRSASINPCSRSLLRLSNPEEACSLAKSFKHLETRLESIDVTPSLLLIRAVGDS
jgi:hypothetical protein